MGAGQHLKLQFGLFGCSIDRYLAEMPGLAFWVNSRVFSKFGNAAIFTKWMVWGKTFWSAVTACPPVC